MASHWHSETDAAGIRWLHLDVAGASINVLSAAVLVELGELLTALAAAPPSGLVFVSDKASGFIAGADVKEFQAIRTHEDAAVLVRRGQAIMDRIEALPCPSVAVIDGFCLGGGLELALACDYRIALDDPKTRLGLPEIRLGIHPGFGGTMRLVRLLGPLPALDLMLTGKTIDARQAQRLGLVDHAVPLRHVHGAVREIMQTRPARRRPRPLAWMLNSKAARPILARQMRARVATKAKPEHYPAPFALIELWRRYADDERVMLDREADSVAKLSMTEAARNLVRAYMLRNRLKATGDKRAFQPRHVHIVGGGTMGGDIAAWIAFQGLRVTVQDTYQDRLATSMQRASALFARRLGCRRQITAAMDRLIPDHKGLGVPRADVVIEAIYEDLNAKQAVYREVESRLKPDALLATNTSSLPIERLTEGLNDPGRLVGLHFFNPVGQMPLVEVIRGPHSRDDMMIRALSFARHIDKLPLETGSAPGFLVNRVLTPYLLEAMIMVGEDMPAAVVDRAARDFGMPVGPLELADSVGLDVALSVAETLGVAYGFEVPERLREMVAGGSLGRKSGRGFYVYQRDKPVRSRMSMQGRDLHEIQERLILRLTEEAAVCLRERVVGDADLIDAGMIFGAGFAPHLGGPLHYRDSRGMGNPGN